MVAAVALVGGFWLVNRWDRAASSEQWGAAERALEGAAAWEGVGMLTTLLNRHPADHVAAERLLDTLGRRRFWLPATAPLPAGTYRATLARDGTVLACAYTNGVGHFIHLRDLRDPLPRSDGGDLQLGTNEVLDLAVIPRGEWVATATHRGTWVWHGRPVAPPRQLETDSKVHRVAWCPRTSNSSGTDQTALLVALTSRIPRTNQPAPLEGTNRQVTVRSWPDGTLQARCGRESVSVEDFAIDRKGMRLATFSEDGTLAFWDLTSGVETSAFDKAHDGHVRRIVFSPGGDRVATASDDGQVAVWDLNRGKLAFRIAESEPLNDVDWSPDGDSILFASENGTVSLVDAGGGVTAAPPSRRLHVCPDASANVARFSPNGRCIAIADGNGRLELHEFLRAGTNAAIRPVLSALKTGGFWCVDFGAEGRTLLTLDTQGGVRLLTWAGNVQPGPSATPPEPLASDNSGANRNPPVWAERLARDLPTVRVLSWDTSPGSNRAAAGCSEGLLLVIRPGRIKPQWQCTFPSKQNINSVRFSPDGTRLAARTSQNEVRLFDVQSGRALADPLVDPDGRAPLRFSASGEHLWSGDDCLWGTPRVRGELPPWLLRLGDAIGRADPMAAPVAAGPDVPQPAMVFPGDWGRTLEALKPEDPQTRWLARWQATIGD
jgi:WD40 repeat protein